MIIYEGQKYACLACIRGHRSTGCGHKDRVLLQVRRRGRKSVGYAPRTAIVSRDCDDTTCKTIGSANSGCCKSSSPSLKTEKKDSVNHKVFHVKSALSLSSDSKTGASDDESYETEKYRFIPVGNGLYKKELRKLMTPSSSSPSPVPKSIPDSTPRVDKTHAKPEQSCDNVHGLNFIDPGSYPSHDSSIPIMRSIQSNISSDSNDLNDPKEQITLPLQVLQTLPRSESTASTDSSSTSSGHAPHVIAPMDLQHNIFDNLGLTEEEANELWPDSAGGGLAYAPLCVMPGQCQCGDGCACENCYQHSRNKLSVEITTHIASSDQLHTKHIGTKVNMRPNASNSESIHSNEYLPQLQYHY